MLVVLEQFSSVTSSTSSGSAKVISTHYSPIIVSKQKDISNPSVVIKKASYVIQSRSVLCRLNHLNGRIVSHHRGVIDRQRHLTKTKASIVQFVCWPRDLENGYHRQCIIYGDVAMAQVDIEKGRSMTGEPAGLNADGTALHGPLGAIL